MRREWWAAIRKLNFSGMHDQLMAPAEDLRAEMTAAARGQVAWWSEAFLRSISLASRSGLR